MSNAIVTDQLLAAEVTNKVYYVSYMLKEALHWRLTLTMTPITTDYGVNSVLWQIFSSLYSLPLFIQYETNK